MVLVRRLLPLCLSLTFACDGGASNPGETEASESSGTQSDPSSGGPESSATQAGSSVTTSATSDGSGTTGTSSTATTSVATDTTGESGGDSSSTGSSGKDANGCPDGAPASWVMCEDFDAVVDPSADLSQWNVSGDRFGVDPDETSDDSDQVLRMRLVPGGPTFGGWVTLRFGEGPDAPHVDSPEGRYEEIWVRYRMRTNAQWPGHSAGDIGELIAMNGANWAIAADLNLYVDNMFRMHPRAWTCIFDGVQACDGSNDWGGALDMLWSTAADYVLTGADSAGQWQCVEARMRLNDVGQSNGEAEVWVDDAQVFLRDGINWRDTWDEYGLNAVRFTNYANAPAVEQDVFFDDVVAATDRIGCDG